MEELAQVYARSLFDAAKEHGKLDELREQLSQFVDALEGNRGLRVFFFSPYFSTKEKQDALQRLLVDADPQLVNFLELLIENHRMPVIFRIRRTFEHLWEQENRLLPVEITSAIALDDVTTGSVAQRIGESTGRRVMLTTRVDPSILGGIVVRVGNSILDASIRNRLEQLRKHVAQGAYLRVAHQEGGAVGRRPTSRGGRDPIHFKSNAGRRAGPLFFN
jgi:F-type H+-transporting ATPase subunit delta